MNLQIELVVRRGPFQGMRYPRALSVGSSLAPKLLGTYELEILSIVEKCCIQPYTEIIDIGCAEGYYAIGFAKRHPQANVYAFDTDANARQLCYEMASLNGVSERVLVKSECNHHELVNLPYRGKSLIFCDCEGYEKALLTEDVIQSLNNHDFLIETHDLFDLEISTVLESRFKKFGFNVDRIESIDDIKKARTYRVPELDNFSLLERFQVLRENRMRIMDWLYCTK